MDIRIIPSKLSGTITAIPSKSQAHRLLICSAFSDQTTQLLCPETNEDIEATAGCLNAIGANIVRTQNGYVVTPITNIPKTAHLDCQESGSTLRFMLPVICALGIDATIHMSGRLPRRPLSPLWEELERMGCKLSRPAEDTIQASGKLHSGIFSIAGNVSSQFITGLLFALNLLPGTSQIHVTGNLESKPYVQMTQEALSLFGVQSEGFIVSGSWPFRSPGTIEVEGDWSNGAFFLAAAALGNAVVVNNLNVGSAQGDREIADILVNKVAHPVISAANIPDLVPIMAIYFAANGGATFTDIARLRLKESDRVESIRNMLNILGIHTETDQNTLTVYGGEIKGGIVDACADHRIAMAAAIASTVASEEITILGAECVAKSYPTFWQEFERLGGKYEQYIR